LAEADVEGFANGHLGFELSVGPAHFAHEAFELDAAVEVIHVADEGDGVLAAAGSWEAQAIVAEEALDVGDELPFELLMSGWIGQVGHCGRLWRKKRYKAAMTHQVHPAIERMA
jgi:hypothetical protein